MVMQTNDVGELLDEFVVLGDDWPDPEITSRIRLLPAAFEAVSAGSSSNLLRTT